MASRFMAQSNFPDLPAGLGRTSHQKTNEIGEVATTDQQSSTTRWVSDQLSDPADGLGLYFGGQRGKLPGTYIGVHGGCQ